MDRLWFVLVFSGSLALCSISASPASAANPFKALLKPFTRSTKPEKPATEQPLHQQTAAEEETPAARPSRYPAGPSPVNAQETQAADWHLPVQGSAQKTPTGRIVRPAIGQTAQNRQPQARTVRRVAPVQTASADAATPTTQAAPLLEETRQAAATQGVPQQAEQQAPQADRIEWYTDLYEAHKVSIQTGKPMLLVFGAEWCHYCKQLENTTLAEPVMIAYVREHYVPVHLDMDKPRDKEVANILGVKPIPCSVVLSPQADLLGKVVGYFDVPSYRMNLEEARGTQFKKSGGRGMRGIGRR